MSFATKSTLLTLTLAAFSGMALAEDDCPEEAAWDDPCQQIVLPGHVPSSTVSLYNDQGVVNNPKPTIEIMHGFRLGYSYINIDTDRDDIDLDSPHMFLMGYEFTQRMYGGDWLNVITIQNVLVGGMDQSKFIPTVNLLVGFEANELFQVGVGPNINFFDPEEKYIHMVAAVGFTPDAGVFNVPIHLSYIPDVDGHWRTAVTTGVNW